jgi:hypothetical protein
MGRNGIKRGWFGERAEVLESLRKNGATAIPAALAAVALGWVLLRGHRQSRRARRMTGYNRGRTRFGGIDEDGYCFCYRDGPPNLARRDVGEDLAGVGHLAQAHASKLVHEAHEAVLGAVAVAVGAAFGLALPRGRGHASHATKAEGALALEELGAEGDVAAPQA